MTGVVGEIRPTTLEPPAALKLRGARLRRRAEAQAFFGALEGIVAACSEEDFSDLVAVYRAGKPLYVNQLERFAGPESILDAIGSAATFAGGSVDLDVYLRRESNREDGYARIKLGGALARPSFRLACEWRDRRWRPDPPASPRDAYEHIVARACDGAVGRFVTGCTASLEALAGRLGELADFQQLRLEVDGSIVVPGPGRLGRLRTVDFKAAARPTTRLSRGEPAPNKLLWAFHDDPYFDFVSWALFDAASRGRWSPPADTRFVRSDAPRRALAATGAVALGLADEDIVVDGTGLHVGDVISVYHRLEGDLRGYAVPGWGGENG